MNRRNTFQPSILNRNQSFDLKSKSNDWFLNECNAGLKWVKFNNLGHDITIIPDCCRKFNHFDFFSSMPFLTYRYKIYKKYGY